jgi:predicted lipoprotein with Yx(FWY)xxD motif
MLNAHRSLLAFAALALLALALAACGGDDDSDSGSPQAANTNGGQTISVESIGGAGEVLVDAQGRALYTNDQDSGKKVACTDECLGFWPPVEAPASGGPTASDSVVQAKLGMLRRPDGSRQVTFDGKPLYRFAEDGPGEVTGDGFTDSFGGTTFVWTVAASPGGEPSTDETTTSDGDDSGGGGYGGGGY